MTVHSEVNLRKIIKELISKSWGISVKQTLCEWHTTTKIQTTLFANNAKTSWNPTQRDRRRGCGGIWGCYTSMTTKSFFLLQWKKSCTDFSYIYGEGRTKMTESITKAERGHTAAFCHTTMNWREKHGVLIEKRNDSYHISPLKMKNRTH